MNIHAAGTLLDRPDPVAPVIVVGEATARPPQDRDSEFLQIIHGVPAKPVDVRNRRLLPYPHPAIDARAEVLREVGVELGPHGPDFLVRVNDRLFIRGSRTEKTPRQQRGQGCGRGGAGEITASEMGRHTIGSFRKIDTMITLSLAGGPSLANALNASARDD
jgi:hypothetical protein